MSERDLSGRPAPKRPFWRPPWRPPWRPAPPPPQPSPTPPPAPYSPGPGEIQAVARLLELHNQLRAAAGVGQPLRLGGLLTIIAKRHSDESAARGVMGHTSADGRTPFQRMQQIGYAYTWAGENVAKGQPDADAVCAGWRGSPLHYQNIINPHFQEVGLAVSYGPERLPYWTADFGSTMMMMQGSPGADDESFEDYPDETCARAYRPKPE